MSADRNMESGTYVEGIPAWRKDTVNDAVSRIGLIQAAALVVRDDFAKCRRHPCASYLDYGPIYSRVF